MDASRCGLVHLGRKAQRVQTGLFNQQEADWEDLMNSCNMLGFRSEVGESWWPLPPLAADKLREATTQEDAVRASGDASLFLSQRFELPPYPFVKWPPCLFHV